MLIRGRSSPRISFHPKDDGVETQCNDTSNGQDFIGIQYQGWLINADKAKE
jgi:hypothetical protein